MSDLTMRLQAQLASNPLCRALACAAAARPSGAGPAWWFPLLVLLYLLLWRLVSQNLEQARGFLQQQRAPHAHLQGARAPQVRAPQASSRSVSTPPRWGLITGSASGQGLNIERLDNQGDGGLQVSLQPTDFARVCCVG